MVAEGGADRLLEKRAVAADGNHRPFLALEKDASQGQKDRTDAHGALEGLKYRIKIQLIGLLPIS